MAKKKRKEPEYALNIFHSFNEQTGKPHVVFFVRTVKEFVSFSYEIILESSIQSREIILKILGLRTTPLIMPGIGPAHGIHTFEHLRGMYLLSVVKLDGEENKFQLEITSNKIAVGDSNQHPFIRVSTERVTLPEF
jgi:hypothetical protein